VITNTYKVRLSVQKISQEFGCKTIKNKETEDFNCKNKEIGKKKIAIKYHLLNAAVCGKCHGMCCGLGERSNGNKRKDSNQRKGMKIQLQDAMS
jgi:hypothetical protein